MPILAAPRSLLLEDLPYYITHLRISHVGIVPSLIEATMGAVQEEEDSGHSSTLRYIASGGEKISDAVRDSPSRDISQLTVGTDYRQMGIAPKDTSCELLWVRTTSMHVHTLAHNFAQAE